MSNGRDNLSHLITHEITVVIATIIAYFRQDVLGFSPDLHARISPALGLDIIELSAECGKFCYVLVVII